MVRKPVKLACVNMKDAGKIMDVSAKVVRAYAERGDLQWIPVDSDKVIPLYEIASLRDITFQEAIDRASIHGAVISYIWIKPTVVSLV